MGGLFVEYMIRLASVCSRMLCGFLRAITHCSKNCFNSQRKNPQPCSCINFSHLMTKIFLPFKAFAETTREKVEEKEFRLSAKCFKISCSRGKHIWLINASELLNSAPLNPETLLSRLCDLINFPRQFSFAAISHAH